MKCSSYNLYCRQNRTKRNTNKVLGEKMDRTTRRRKIPYANEATSNCKQQKIEPNYKPTFKTGTDNLPSLCNVSTTPKLEHSEAESSTPVPFLPEEILTEIWKFLSSDDRKNFKLVCRDWFYACCMHEKICIGSEYLTTPAEIHRVLATLCESPRPAFNFEFCNPRFENTIPIERFWRTCGSRIVSLKLDRCQVSDHLVHWILKLCFRLQVLEWCFGTLKDMEELVAAARRILSSPVPKNRSLRTLRVQCDFKWRCSLAFWLNLQQTMFDLFPSITDFEFCEYDLFCLLAPDISQTHPRMTKAERNVALMDENQLRKKLRKCYAQVGIKNLAMNFLFSQDFLYDSLTDVTGLTKITEINVSSNLGVSNESFLRFAHEQKNLKKITCISNELIQRNDLDDFVPEILKIRSLREFQLLFFASPVDWNSGWNSYLSACSVETFRIMCTQITFSRGSSDLAPSSTTLNQFAINAKNSYIVNSLHVANLLRTFPNLKYLYLSHANEIILESVCENQVKLRCLSVEDMVADDDSSTSTNFLLSFNKLTDLRSLQLPQSFTSSHQMFLFERRSTLIEENRFDKLTALRISGRGTGTNIFYPDNFEVYRCLSSTLEAVWIDRFVRDRDHQYESARQSIESAIIGFVSEQKSLKVLNLQYVLLDYYNIKWLTLKHKPARNMIDVIAEYSFVQKVFDRCPSLQIFIYRGAFVRDVVTKAVRPFEHDFLAIETEIMRRYFIKPTYFK